MITWVQANALASRVGSAFYLFREDVFRQNLRDFHSSFLQGYYPVALAYSYKTNHTPYLCRVADDEGCMAEVVSEMEFMLARSLGVPGNRIVFNGPLKSHLAVRESLLHGATINVDSLEELRTLVRIAQVIDPPQARIVLRCNFDFGNSRLSRFGIPAPGSEFDSAVRLARTSGITRLVGLHCHYPDRRPTSFHNRAIRLVDLALRTFQEHVPEQLNFGGGYYGRMGDELRRRLRAPRTSFQEYAEPIIQRMTEAFPEAASRPLVVLEPGTGVVADAFSFVCRVTGVKRVWETNVATVAGSLLDVTPTANRALLPAEVIARHVRPAALRPWTVGGFTCMEDDLLSEDMLGAVEVGDFMVFANAGSYSISMRPPFIAPRAPIVSIGEGFDLDSARLIKRPETIQDVFASFSSDGWDLPQD